MPRMSVARLDFSGNAGHGSCLAQDRKQELNKQRASQRPAEPRKRPPPASARCHWPLAALSIPGRNLSAHWFSTVPPANLRVPSCLLP